MFVRGQITYAVECPLDLAAGISSVVLFPLPSPSDAVEDIGQRLQGLHIGSATLTSNETQFTQAAGRQTKMVTFAATDNVCDIDIPSVTSSPLSSPPASLIGGAESESDLEEMETRKGKMIDLETLSDKSDIFKFGKDKRIYNTDKRYMVYQSQSQRPLAKPPFDKRLKLDGSLYSHAQMLPSGVRNKTHFWAYTTSDSQSREGSWQVISKGDHRTFGPTKYYLHHEPSSGPSWRKST